MKEKPLLTAEKLDKMSPQERAKALFSGSHIVSNDVNQWAKDHPTEYSAARNLAMGPSRLEGWKQDLGIGKPHRSFSEEEQRAMNAHPMSELEKYYKGKATPGEIEKYDLSRIKRESPELAYQIELSAYLLGLKPNAPVRPPAPQQPQEVPFDISDEQCKRFGIPVGSKATMPEFLRYVETAAKLEQEAKEKALAETLAENKAA